MSMFTAARYFRHRFCSECNIQSMDSEHVSNHIFHHVFIICRLHCRSVLPIYFQLFHYLIVISRTAHLSLGTAYFLVPHLHFKSVFIQHHQGLFQRRPDRPYRSLPILLFQYLRRRQLFHVPLIIGSFHPEFQFSCRCQQYFLNIIIGVDIYVIKYIPMPL